jgi:hypothetical protein
VESGKFVLERPCNGRRKLKIVAAAHEFEIQSRLHRQRCAESRYRTFQRVRRLLQSVGVPPLDGRTYVGNQPGVFLEEYSDDLSE